MRIRVEVTVERPHLGRPRRPRTLVALAVVALALLLPAVVLANHQFTDVPTAHTFHTNISNLANAGVTAGCGGGNYCPEQAVSRGQMAGFLNRGLGRVAEADIAKVVTGLTQDTIGSVTITPGTPPGAVPGATQFVRGQFTGTIRFTDISGCPCQFHLFLHDGDLGLATSDVVLTVNAANVYFPISAGGVTAKTGSAPVTIYVTGSNNSAQPTTSYEIFGNLVAEMFPFGSTGTNAP